MIGRSAGSYFWGRFADRDGRMPVMYTGLCFIALLSLAFGFSTNFVWLLRSGELCSTVLQECLAGCVYFGTCSLFVYFESFVKILHHRSATPHVLKR